MKIVSTFGINMVVEELDGMMRTALLNIHTSARFPQPAVGSKYTNKITKPSALKVGAT